MIRQIYQTEEQVVNGIQVYNLHSLDWSSFKYKKMPKKYYLNVTDCDKFYYVIEGVYGRNDLEDFIYVINGIEDPLDLQPGQEIFLPDISDIEEFLLLQKTSLLL